MYPTQPQPPTSFTPSAPSRLGVGIGAAVVALVTLTLTLSILGFTRAGTVSVMPVTSQQTGITVCGHGKANAHPDQARIAAGVFAQASTAQDARSQAAQAMNAVISALKNNGVADDDIQTEYFSITPQYSYESGGPHQIGYQASNNVTATVRNVNAVGTVVDAVTAAGGNNVVVSGIQFSAGDPSQAQAAAEASALADAHQQAQQIASGAGVSLGAPVSIQVGGCGQTQQPVVYAGAAQAASGSTTPIQPGQLNVDEYVDVVYSIR
jgi:uncharacterized protein YggE